MKTKLAALRARLTAITSARKWAHAHKAYITLAVIGALHLVALTGIKLPAADIQHVVSAIVG